MKLRTVLRNSDHQIGVEKRGAISTDFLTAGNISWLLSHLHQWEAQEQTPETLMILHETLNEKLQSKVEYRCINCSPFLIRFGNCNSYKPFQIVPSITDENKYTSLHLIAPLLKPGDAPFKFLYLAGSHKLPVLPRGIDIAGYYQNDIEFVLQNFSLLSINAGEAAIFLSNVPVALPDTSIPILEIQILPYEARQIIYEGTFMDTGCFLQPYETDLESFIKYNMGVVNAKNDMKALKLIPYTPSYLSENEKYTLRKTKTPLEKLHLQLTRLRNRFYC